MKVMGSNPGYLLKSFLLYQSAGSYIKYDRDGRTRMQRGRRWDASPTLQIKEQLTLFNSGGRADYALKSTTRPPGFSDLPTSLRYYAKMIVGFYAFKNNFLNIFFFLILHRIPLEFAKMKAYACLPVTSLLSITAIATQSGKDEIVP